jgi:hypothetical protein
MTTNKPAGKAASETKDTKARSTADWERIEADYRAGVLSVREIATANGVSHTAIQKKAKAKGWEQDLQAKIKAKADSLVAKREVAAEVAAQRVETDKVIVEANAQVIANIRLAHRADIRRMRALCLEMLGELEHETGNIDLFEELGDMLRAEDEKGQDKRNDLYRKVISSAGRIDSLKKLAETLKVLVALEREAYGIDDAQDDGPRRAIERIERIIVDPPKK